MTNEIAKPCTGYLSMTDDWQLIHDLLGGTGAMRAAGEKWLPKESAEVGYEARLSRSFLYNAYRDTLRKLTNRPFSNPIQITDLPEELGYLENDVDGVGTSFESFAKSVLYDLIDYGLVHIFVDHTELPEIIEGTTLTKADETRLGARVLLSVVHPPDLIGWQTEIVDKKIELTQIRIRETRIESSGSYGDEELNYIKIYTKNTWEIHQEVKDDENQETTWVKVDEGQHTFGRISLLTIYANKKGFMIAEPCLLDLAWLNLAHWQSYSDQRNILRFSRFALLFGKGLSKDMVNDGIAVGPAKAFLVKEENADMKYVEHTGKATEAGAKDLEDLEIKMEILGQQPLMRSAEMSTATAKRIDETRNISQLQSWIKSLEIGLLQAIEMACEWRKINLPESTKINVFSDFEVSIYGSTDKELLLKIRIEGEITRERFLRELQRRGVFSSEMDPEKEAEAVNDEDMSGLRKAAQLEDEDEDEDENEDKHEDEEEK